MMRKFYAFLMMLTVALSGSLYAQTGAGELRGKVVDVKTKEGIPFAGVIVELRGSQVAAQQTDFDGNFSIKPITPGTYDVRVKIIGYNERLINGVIITSNKQTYLNPDMVTSVRTITEVTVTDYAKPLIERDETTSGGSLNADEIVKLPTRNINSLVATTAGVYQSDEGEALSVKGSRTDANDYYIDGVKVRGSTNLPQNSIEQISVITGGVPAQYGDATGGIISITTKGPSKDFGGGVEAVTSEFLDGYGYNLISGNFRGPIMTRNKGEENERPLLGFFASMEFESKRDQDPSAVGAYEAKDGWLNEVRSHVLTRTTLTRPDLAYPTGNLTTFDQLNKVKAQAGNEARNLNFSGRLDFQPNLNSTFAVGFSGSNQHSRVYNRTNMLFNSDKNAEYKRTTFRVYGRYIQKFNNSSEDNSSLLKNAYYQLQVDYSKDYQVQQDPDHKDNFFNYGYVGKFDIDKNNMPIVALSPDNYYVVNGDTMRYELGGAYGTVDTLMRFTPGSANPYLAGYNQQTLDFVNENGIAQPRNLAGFQSYNGLLNGQVRTTDLPRAYGGLFNMPGAIVTNYSLADRDQYRFSAMASADIKNHSIQVGLEYEQRVEASYAIAPISLWTIMRAQANTHNILNRNLADPSNVYTTSGDTILWTRYNSYTDSNGNMIASAFARNIRSALGLQPGDYVNVDAYDPSTYSLDMFDADDLLRQGLVTYSGYNYTGKKGKSSVSFTDFFNDPTNRAVGAFRPVYTAGYIQDKFTYKDVIFNLGVRIDRFDANQQVLKDKYVIYETIKASSVNNRPGNIGDDFVVYVDDSGEGLTSDIINGIGIKGYRSGDVFYDASGNVVQNVAEINGRNGSPNPGITNNALVAGRPTLTSGAFKDYEPQTQVMPRIAFSFPISEDANFFANYDVLTQRPRTNVFSNPITYLQLDYQFQGLTLVSPDIKPEKSINYQFGFKQRVSQTSALTFTAFYRELKDNFQIVNINYAYPISYNTYTNRDFGTIKGLTVQYDLRRTNNLSANVAYTLQFANGTGSRNNSATNLISSGEIEPIRVQMPLEYDQRHTIVTTFDYRYGRGAEYNGSEGLRSVLQSAGANMIFRAGSGTPYSRISRAQVQDILNASDTRFRRLIGEINGSRLPWEFNVDIRIDKDFYLTSGSDDNRKKQSTLNIYLLVQNVFDFKRIAAVYPATGLPNDDGYLQTDQAANLIPTYVDPQAYLDMYSIRVNNPDNYKLPRVIRVGAIYNF